MRWLVGLVILGVALGVWYLGGGESRERVVRRDFDGQTIPIKELPVKLLHSAYPPPIDLDNVDRDRDLHGVVVRAADGKPVPGARIALRFYVRRALNLVTEYGQEGPADGPTTISAVDGSFAIPIAADVDCDLEVSADGYAPSIASMCRAGGHVRIELAEPVSLSLTVLDAEGAPVEGASVWMVRHFNQDPPALDLRAQTDSSGRLVLRDLPAGLEVSLDVEHPRHGSRRWHRDFALPASGNREQEIRFEAGRRIHGRVTDIETGAPIAGARVGTGRYWSPYVTETNEDGRYELGGWTFPDYVTMAVNADGYGAEGAAIGPQDEIDFQLSRGFVVRGFVVGPDARPIVGERVSAIGRGFASRGAPASVRVLSMRSGTTAEDGSFEVDGLRHRTRHALVIAAVGFGRVVYEILPPARGASAEVDVGRIELPVARSIRGRLVRGEQPVANKRIELIGSNADRERMLGGERSHGAFDGNRVYERTDDLGRFSFGDLAKGTYVVRYREPGSPYVNKSVELADVDAEVLVEAPEGRPLPVVVVDGDDRPVAGATLWVEMEDDHTAIQTDKHGRAVVRLTSAAKSIHARPNRAGLVPVLVKLRGDEHDLRIVLESGLAIRGVAVTDAGVPIARPVVEAQRDGKKVASTTGNAKGEFTLRVSAGEPCRLHFAGEGMPSGGHASGRWAGSLESVIPGGERVRLVVSSPTRNRSLTVRVLLPDGTPVVGADIVPFGKTDANGERKLVNLSARPMPLWLQWKTSEYAMPKMQTVVPDGQTIELRLRTANPITGRLVRDGKPVAKARVSIQRAKQALAYTETDAQGQFRLLVAADEAGPFCLDVSVPGVQRLSLSGVAAGAKNLTVRWKDLEAR